MAPEVTDITNARRTATLATFKALRTCSESVFLTAHFRERWGERLPGLTIAQIMRAIENGVIARVGPGKYKDWKITLSHTSAGEEFGLVCEVRDDRLVLITCWEGAEDAFGQ